jgi:anti-anti-sigma factor
MELSVSQENARVPVTVLHVKGNIDSSTYQEFQGAVEKLVAEGTKDLLLDLHDVPYISSAGLRALNQIYNKLRASSEDASSVAKGVADGTYKSPHLKILAPSKRVLETLRMSGFDMFLDIHSQLASAIASF